MGRKSTFSQEKADKICELLAEGDKSLRQICLELELKPSTVVLWANSNAIFAEQYARAREIGTDLEFDSLIDLASEPPPKVKGYTDAAWVTHRRNLVDAKKWTLSKRSPKKYGDKLALAGDEDNPIAIKRVIS